MGMLITENSFPVTKNLLQGSRGQRTCYFFCLHCCLINIHVFDFPDSQLSRLFNTQVPTSPDNRGLTVVIISCINLQLWPHIQEFHKPNFNMLCSSGHKGIAAACTCLSVVCFAKGERSLILGSNL